jgi:hypothetical protein
MQVFQPVIVAASLIVWLNIFRRWLTGRPIVPFEPRLSVSWIGSDVFLLIVALPVFDSIAIGLSRSQVAQPAGEISASVLAAITGARLLWIAFAIVYLEKRTAARPVDIGFDTSHIRDDARLGFLAFLAAALPVYGTVFVVSQLFPQTEHQLARLVREQPGGGLLGLAALSAIIVAPLAEELLFRVILQGWFERQMEMLRERRGNAFAKASRALPILASSAAFAVMHEGYDRIALFVLALFLGFLYQQTHRIYPSLILHACVNALAVIGLSLGEG